MKWIQNIPGSGVSAQQICGCAAAADSDEENETPPQAWTFPSPNFPLSFSLHDRNRPLLGSSIITWDYHFFPCRDLPGLPRDYFIFFKSLLPDLPLSSPSSSFLQSCWISIILNPSQRFLLHSGRSAVFARVAFPTAKGSGTLQVPCFCTIRLLFKSLTNKRQKKVKTWGWNGSFTVKKHFFVVCFPKPPLMIYWVDEGEDQTVSFFLLVIQMILQRICKNSFLLYYWAKVSAIHLALS